VRKFPLNYGTFAICAWDPTVLVPVADGGNCVPSGAITIDAANANSWMWVPLMDGSKHIIAEINARGANLGAVNANLFVNTSGTVRDINGKYYLDRNLSIEPQTPGAAKIRLFIKNTEFQALQTVDPTIIGIGNLKANKTSAACGPVFIGPNTTIVQDTSGNYGTDHFIEFSVQSFSSFFVDGGLSALPLEFLSFKAEKNSSHIILNWTVLQEATIEKFEVQRSNNGISFNTIGEQQQHERLTTTSLAWQYRFTDKTPAPGLIYYRVKMIDVNGKQVFSKVVSLNAGEPYTGALSVYPNPVLKNCVIRMPVSVTMVAITLYNSSGAIIKKLPRQSLANGVCTLDMQAESAGIYMLQVNDGRNNYQYKLIKQ
jgi:hypothetical protein